MRLKKCLLFVVMLAFVIATMPLVSQASMGHEAATKMEKTHDGGHDCHHAPAAQPFKKAHHHTKKCGCDAFCKCLGNGCGGSAKVFLDAERLAILPVTAQPHTVFFQPMKFAEFLDRLKRPPRH